MNEGTFTRPYKSARQSTEFGGTPVSRFGEDYLLGGPLGSQYYDIVDNCLDITRNTSIGRAVLGVLEDYVGGTGVTPVVVGSEQAKKVWNDWSNNFVNIQGTKNLNQILRDLIVNSAGSGDVLITTPIDPDEEEDQIQLRIELTSGARIRTPDDYLNGKKDKFGNIVKFGVAFKNGKEVGYYVQNKRDLQRTNSRAVDSFTYVPRFDSETGRFNAFLFRNPSGQMAEQTRGLPILFPVVQEVKDLSELWDSAISGARNKNLLSVIVTSDDVNSFYAGAGGVDEAGNLKKGADAGEIIGDLVDGAIVTMPSGGEVKAINSSGMIDLDSLFQRSNRYLCSGIGIPVEILFKDFSQTNFSSGKLAMDSFFRKTEFWSKQISELFGFFYKLVNIEASLKGIGVPMSDLTEEALAVKFAGGQNYVDADPAKSSKAEALRIDINTTTATQELGKKGLTYEQILVEKAQEIKKAETIAELEEVPIEFLLPKSNFEKAVVEEELELEAEKVENETQGEPEK